ncbi:MAG: glycine cleavage system protein GcvH [Planctomycetota bacterium]
MIPEDLEYTKEHEWVRVEGNLCTLGITDHAQKALGEIVFVDLPKVGTSLHGGETFGSVESVKAVADCYLPVDGIVTEVNTALAESPETVNSDPYGDGWMIVFEPADAEELGGLMDAATYEEFLEKEKE